MDTCSARAGRSSDVAEPFSPLDPAPRRGARVARGAVWVVALSGLILYGPARAEMGPAAATLMLLHLLLGLVVGIGALGVCLLRLRTTGAALTLSVALCLGTGAIMAARAAGGSPLGEGFNLLPLHILSGVAAVLLALLRGRSLRSLVGPLRRGFPSSTGAGETPVAAGPRPAAVAALVLALPLVAAVTPHRYDAESYYRALTSTNAAQAGNPHFPAGIVQEGRRPWRDRPASYCGAAGCHETDYREWQASAHAHAATDPFYQASLRSYVERIGEEAARWCVGCHEPTALLSANERPGAGDRTALWAAAPPRAARAAALGIETGPPAPHGERDREELRGVDCLTCHATTRVRDLTGNGRFAVAMPSEYPFALRREPTLRWLHAFFIRLRPGPHRAAFMKPALHRSSEFCSSCHRMSFNVPQNGYRFLLGADEYGAWLEGPASGHSIHGFYPLSEGKTCTDCHMRDGRGGGTLSHAFLGGNTALPALRGDGPHLRATERFLQDGVVSLDLFALRRAAPGQPHQEELIAPLETARADLRPGESVVLDVVLRNRGAGHHFPGGLGDLRDAWVEVTVTDADGRRLLASGLQQPDGTRDPQAHDYSLLALDRWGRRIEQNNLDEMIVAVPPFTPRVIPSGQADLVRYRFTVPHARGPLKVTARLLHRSVNAAFAHRVLQNADLPVTVIARDSLLLPLAAGGVPGAERGAPDGREREVLAGRFYDYGVALLGQRDLGRALRAMRRVAELLPGRVDGPFGLGRVYLEEGDLIAARAQFEAALRLAPDDVRPRLFLGKTFRKMGQYEAALAILQPLARQFPRDRALQFEIGQCHLLSGRYEAAAEAFRRMLDLDPNDLSAHYNLMTCYRQLRRFPDARREEAIYRYLKEDESVRRLTADYLETRPFAAREAQSIHEHVLR